MSQSAGFLTNEQKDYVRGHCNKIAVSTIALNLHTSPSEVMKLVVQEKLSIKIKKPYQAKRKRNWDINF